MLSRVNHSKRRSWFFRRRLSIELHLCSDPGLTLLGCCKINAFVEHWADSNLLAYSLDCARRADCSHLDHYQIITLHPLLCLPLFYLQSEFVIGKVLLFRVVDVFLKISSRISYSAENWLKIVILVTVNRIFLIIVIILQLWAISVHQVHIRDVFGWFLFVACYGGHLVLHHLVEGLEGALAWIHYLCTSKKLSVADLAG